MTSPHERKRQTHKYFIISALSLYSRPENSKVEKKKKKKRINCAEYSWARWKEKEYVKSIHMAYGIGNVKML